MAGISTDNYSIGAIDIYFADTIAHASLLATCAATAGLGGQFRAYGNYNLGNIVSAEINPDVTYVDHFINDCGKRKKDKTVANTESLMINFEFDELNADNMQKFFLAATDLSETNRLAVFESTIKEGSAQVVFHTDTGQDFVYFIPKCSIRPDGAFSPNNEDWITIPAVLEVLFYNTNPWASKPYGFVLASAIDCS